MEELINELQLVALEPDLTIEFDAVNDWLYITWIGKHTKTSALEACKKIEMLLRNQPCSKVLNVNKDFILSWAEAPIWAIKSWFPRLFVLGCSSFAWVLSENFKTGPIITEVFNTKMPFLQAMVFNDEQTAAEWLKEI